jgi:hypothetical protein
MVLLGRRRMSLRCCQICCHVWVERVLPCQGKLPLANAGERSVSSACVQTRSCPLLFGRLSDIFADMMGRRSGFVVSAAAQEDPASGCPVSTTRPRSGHQR